jgi:multiple sugar transport system substrate-binding protein
VPQIVPDVVAGRVAMFIGANYQAPSLEQQVPGGFINNWGVAPIPSEDGSSHGTFAGGWLWSIFTKDAQKADAATSFAIQAFVGDEGMARWCSIGGYLPTRDAAFSNPAYQGNAYTPTFRDHLNKYSATFPPTTRWNDISGALETAIGSVVSGSQPADAALQDAVASLK